MDILRFTGEYEFLSNMYPHPIKYEGIEYPCVTTAFYALSVADKNARVKIARLRGNKAKTKALNMLQREDWNEVKNDIMMELLRVKFSDGKMKDKLLETDEANLVNNITYYDYEYGVKDGKGKNWLGKLLMKLRDELRN